MGDRGWYKRSVWESVVARAAGGGLDLAAVGERAQYDAAVEIPHRLDVDPAWGVLLVLGHSKAIWDPFVAWLAADRRRITAPHPLDTYAEQVVSDALDGVTGACRWLHDRARPRLSAARLAAITGLASAGPAGLSAHPEFGPWIALRAVVVLPGSPGAAAGVVATRPCGGCDAPCERALQDVLDDGATVDHEGVASNWRRWVGVRDACPVGRSHRYDAAALAYHYTKDIKYLHELVDAHTGA